MNKPKSTMFLMRPAAALVLVPAVMLAGLQAAHAKDAPPPEIPTCDKKIGTLAVKEPEETNPWWSQMQLESPAALIAARDCRRRRLSGRWPPAARSVRGRTSARAR